MAYISREIYKMGRYLKGQVDSAFGRLGDGLKEFFLERARNVALVTYNYGPKGRFSYQFRYVFEHDKFKYLKTNINGQIRSKVQNCCVLVGISGGGGGRILFPNVPLLLYSQPLFGFSGKFEFFYFGCPKNEGEFIVFDNEKVSGQFKATFSAATRYQIKKKISKFEVSAFAEGGLFGKWFYDFSDGKSDTDAGFYARAVGEVSIGGKVWHRVQKGWNTSDVDF